MKYNNTKLSQVIRTMVTTTKYIYRAGVKVVQKLIRTWHNVAVARPRRRVSNYFTGSYFENPSRGFFTRAQPARGL